MKYVRKRMELPAGRGVWAPRRPRTPGGGCCPSSAYCRSAAWSPRCPASTRVCSRGPRSILLVYLIYIARHVSDVWQGMDSSYSHSSLYLMLLLWYDKCPCLRPVPAASSVHSRRVASVHRVSILTGHWTLDTGHWHWSARWWWWWWDQISTFLLILSLPHGQGRHRHQPVSISIVSCTTPDTVNSKHQYRDEDPTQSFRHIINNKSTFDNIFQMIYAPSV